MTIPGYNPKDTAGDCRYDKDAAAEAVGFFSDALTHVKGDLAKQPFVLRPWQEDIIRSLFGWYRLDGTRRYREAFIFIPRKNGKTLMAAGIVNYMLFVDNEPGAEIYSAAAEREQAALVFSMVRQQILAQPQMASMCRIYHRSITMEDQAVVYKPLSADADTKYGFNCSCVIIDELHAHKNREMVDALITGTGARRQPLVVHITTADYDRPSICNAKYDYACKVRDGIIDDPSFLPVIYEATRDDDWTSAATWRKANPNFEISISEDYLKRECARAQAEPAYENVFKRFHLNIKTEQASRMISMDQWDTCALPSRAPINNEDGYSTLAGRPCFAGLDLSRTTDLTACVLVFPDTDEAGNQTYEVLCRFWVPGESAEKREKRDRVPYLQWARQGHIELTDGNSVDYRTVRQRINEDGKRFDIQEIAYDPFNASHLMTELVEEDGFAGVQFRQGMLSMAPPTKELMRLLQAKAIHHGGNPVLRWMASNAAVRTDHAENIMPNKAASHERIDGIVALVMGIGRAMIKQTHERSVYEDNELLII